MKIGHLELGNPFILAPLAGYSDLPFRLLCREYGADLCFSEMISCHGLVYQQPNTLAMLKSVEAERPVAMQLFGSDPARMGEAAAILSQYPIDLIDINMGCPVRKVVKKGAGAALMKEPALAAQIIRQVREHSRVPITVKTRTGWSHERIIAPAFAAMAEEAGASAIILHARTWSDGFSGTPDWSQIAAVKKAVAIPVIGNGDIHSRADGLAMLAQTGCDGVMIGRAAMGNPTIFRKEPYPASLSANLTALHRHLQLIALHQPSERLQGTIKSHAGRYVKGFAHAAQIRLQIYATQGFSELYDLIAGLLTSGI